MRLAVVGLGNVLLGDDGFGPFVVELLSRRYAFPPEVELLDLGAPGLGLTSYLAGFDAVVIVDTVAGVEAGELRVYERTALERPPAAPRLGPHDPAVAEALTAARLAGTGPHAVWLVGAAPGSCAPGATLGRKMRAAAETAALLVRRRVEACGFAVQSRDAGEVEPEWWRSPRPWNVPTDLKG